MLSSNEQRLGKKLWEALNTVSGKQDNHGMKCDQLVGCMQVVWLHTPKSVYCVVSSCTGRKCGEASVKKLANCGVKYNFIGGCFRMKPNNGSPFIQQNPVDSWKYVAGIL